MICVKNISKTFKLYHKPSDRLKEIILRSCFHKEFKAVVDVSFDVSEGETLGIVGQNGAGKSTILKLLTGILIPDIGSVHVSGRITGLLELGTGFNSEFSGFDNIIHNATYLGLSRHEIDQRMDQIIAFTELKDFIKEPIKTYSSGMIMRLAFSVAIHADPSAFVVDEALSVGDAYFQQKCIKKIKEFKDNGGSIVFVSHDMNAVKVLCDQAILLDNGRVIDKADPESIINGYNFLIARKSKGEEIQYQKDSPSSGYGNRKVVIEKVSLVDKGNIISKTFTSGRPFKIVVRLLGREEVENLTLGILIRDKFGQDMYGTNTHHLKQKLDIQENRTVFVAYEFEELNLGPGKYSVTVAVHAGSSHVDECFHWVDRGAEFEVVSGEGPVFTGLLRMTPELKISGKESKEYL